MAPTCDDAAMAPWTAADVEDQTGRVALVTGANSGLGLRTAEALAAKGARVLLGCRNAGGAATALDQVRRRGGAGDQAEVVTLDLADLASVRSAADDVAGRVDRLDLLVNNAGAMALPQRRTADGFEVQFGTNHLGHFAFTGLVLPLLLDAEAARVVTVSSTAHKIGKLRWDDLMFERGYRRWSAYGQSKLANLLFAFELDRRAASAGVPLVSVAAHPGLSSTNLQAAGPEMEGKGLKARAMAMGTRLVGQSDAAGALPQLYAATAPEVSGGEFFGPDGPAEARGHPTRVVATKPAYGTEEAARLWARSEELTGVTYPWPAPAT